MRSAGALALAALALFLSAPSVDAGAAPEQDDQAGVDPVAVELAERYAPIVVLKQQEQPCDTDGEAFAPASVDIVLDNPDIVLRQVGHDDPVIDHAPTAADLFDRGEGFYLDFPGLALEPGCIYEADFDRYSVDQPAVVYAHVASQPDRPGQLALQYWTFWYYNDWNNKHEGDWEGISILFDADSAAAALETTPVEIGYAQHEGGERADWDASKLTREGDRPVVYSSAGSHASYFGSALYLGRSGSEGFGCDNTDGPSTRLDPVVVVLPDDVDDPASDLAWLAFDGRWGERNGGPFNGPTGPRDKDRWDRPIDWHDELRASSVVVPAGDGYGTAVVNSFCDVVEAGSDLLIFVTSSPAVALVVLIVVATVAGWLTRRTDWTPVARRPLVMPRRGGQILRASLAAYRTREGFDLARIGLLVVPVSLLTVLAVAIVRMVPLVSSLVDLAADDSAVSLVLGLVAPGVTGIVAFVAGSALVAAWVDGERTVAESVHIVLGRWRPLLGGFLRSAAIVAVLAITVIGIPWAIRQAVRYQFLAPAVVVDELDGRAALDRSSTLTRGRWWHTALFAVLAQATVAVVAMVVGLLLLIVLSGVPLWLFSGLISVVVAAVVPLAALAMVLLYGDAVAQIDSADRVTVGV
ncbi:MAG: Vps62-related protein [Actinomycetota bacterium]